MSISLVIKASRGNDTRIKYEHTNNNTKNFIKIHNHMGPCRPWWGSHCGVFGGMQVIFYQDYLGLSAKWITIAATIYAIWNAINDPLFGHITDNTRSKHGRRVPFMRFTAPFLALFFIMVWLVPQGWDKSAFLLGC